MKFKVGDKVRVKKDLEEGHDYKYYVDSEMQELAGRIVTIKRVGKESYEIEEDNRFWEWTEDMLEELKKPTKDELLKMPEGTKVITDKERNNEFIFDGDDVFENEVGDYFWDTDINKDLGLEDEDCGTKIIEIQTPKYEIYWKENNENKSEETNILILTHIINNTIKTKDVNLNNLPKEEKEKIMTALEEVLKG